MFTRRFFLFNTVAGGALALAGCATMTNPTTGVVTIGLSPSILDAIQGAVAFAAKYIPTVESIISLAAGLFGPGYAALVQAGTVAFNTIVSTLEGVVTNLPVAARARLAGRLAASSPYSPVPIGAIKTSRGTVAIKGYRPS